MQNTKLIKKISTSLVSTGEIIDSLQSNSSTSAPSIRAVVDNMTPPQNLLINGDFQIWQRGEYFTIEGDEAFHYTADMWCVYASTGQTITVKKTTDGLQFSGTSVIMQRMSPLKVGQKYVFLCKVDGDVKTLSIVGGTYIENDFLRYNKGGSYEQFQIKSNGTTNIENARLWEGDTVYKLIKEDKTIALMRCQRKIIRLKNIMFSKISGVTFVGGFLFPVELDSLPNVVLNSIKESATLRPLDGYDAIEYNTQGVNYVDVAQQQTTQSFVTLDITFSCEPL